jgi:hypothetical protein
VVKLLQSMNEAVQDPNSFETPLDTDQAVEQAMRTIAFALEKSVRSVASDLIVQSWRRSAKRVADLPQANALLQETLTRSPELAPDITTILSRSDQAFDRLCSLTGILDLNQRDPEGATLLWQQLRGDTDPQVRNRAEGLSEHFASSL